MKITIERGLPAVDYHSRRAASSTRIKELLRSPAHLKFMDENGKTAEALTVGEAFHSLVLEPKKFREQFAVAPKVDRRTKDGREAWQMFVDANPGVTLLTEDQYLAVTGMSEAIMRHPMANELVLTRTETELSLFWEQLDMKCKARIDAYNLEHRCIIDLKSCDDADRDGFARSIARFKYHVQAAWYIDAARAAGLEVETMVFIAVEKVAPYGVACYTLDDQAIEEGRIQIAKALPLMANCEALNLWPGYDPGLQTISLPRWSVKGEEASL